MFHFHHILKELKKLMSKFLDDLDAAIDKITTAHGAATGADLSQLKTEVLAEVKVVTDAQTQLLGTVQADLAASQSNVASLQSSLVADEGIASSLLARVTDVETGLTHVVNHLANGNTADALAAATAVLQSVGNAA